MKQPINISLDYMDYINYYSYFLESKSDPRTGKWFLMGSPGPLLTVLATYLYFCVFAGPRFMKDRKPFILKNTIQIYNFVQIVLSVILVYEACISGWVVGYKFACQPVDYSDDPQAVRMAGAVWFYFICKVIELLDTIFFVLRKKTNQVTFLHVYHHSMMPLCSWIGVKFLAGGHGTLLGLINSFIHIIMYSYYFVSSLGPQYQKYLWWKKHLTALQMLQFVIIVFQNVWGWFQQCDYPKIIILLLGTQAFFFLYLFGRFYYYSYVKQSTIEKAPTTSIANGKTIKVN